MSDVLFLSLYGLLFIAGIFMFPAWLGVGRQADGPDDKVLGYGLAVNSLGTVVVFGTRLVIGFKTGNWTTFGGGEGAFVMFGCALMEAGKVMLMIFRKRRGSEDTWTAFAVLSVAWALFAVVWVLS